MLRLLLLIVFGVVLSGCFVPSETSVTLVPTNSINRTFTAQEINDQISAIIAAQPIPFAQNITVNLQPGEVIISGEREGLRGSITVILFAGSGQLQVMPTAIDFAGLTLQDAAITELSEALQTGLNDSSGLEGDGLQIQSILVLVDRVEIRFAP
ncbi:MAG: hypothetical protein MUF87_13085 [Anaerolineae bacterium]|nr:hypothetical protein [Anaerolineae bacterium]